MKKSIVGLLIMLFWGSFFSAQAVAVHPLVHAGYVYQNQSFGELGGRVLFLRKDQVLWRAGAAALMGSVNGKGAVLPKIQGEVLFNFGAPRDVSYPYYFLVGVEATSKYASPKAGLNVLGLLDFSVGYALPFGAARLNEKRLEGLNFGVTLNVPLVVFKK
ncbi:hypothetical protein [Bergeyella sp. RCAD1439]|uniref:hypothetical protein n=1 Tax=Bergeyella anatis TaxID=3113737 RepID=UPI002E18A185|nr:hypothetical protein [Bergeyella sp. RCAD1439]